MATATRIGRTSTVTSRSLNLGSLAQSATKRQQQPLTSMPSPLLSQPDIPRSAALSGGSSIPCITPQLPSQPDIPRKPALLSKLPTPSLPSPLPSQPGLPGLLPRQAPPSRGAVLLGETPPIREGVQRAVRREAVAAAAPPAKQARQQAIGPAVRKRSAVVNVSICKEDMGRG